VVEGIIDEFMLTDSVQIISTITETLTATAQSVTTTTVTKTKTANTAACPTVTYDSGVSLFDVVLTYSIVLLLLRRLSPSLLPLPRFLPQLSLLLDLRLRKYCVTTNIR